MTVSYAWLKCISTLCFFNLPTDIGAKYNGHTAMPGDKTTNLKWICSYMASSRKFELIIQLDQQKKSFATSDYSYESFVGSTAAFHVQCYLSCHIFYSLFCKSSLRNHSPKSPGIQSIFTEALPTSI